MKQTIAYASYEDVLNVQMSQPPEQETNFQNHVLDTEAVFLYRRRPSSRPAQKDVCKNYYRKWSYFGRR